jgi:LuxR family maltose regulon positive regulatory protein
MGQDGRHAIALKSTARWTFVRRTTRRVDALIESKLYAPRRRHGLVPRTRLAKRLERAAEAKLTLVSAPAGFGKTTLLAAWLARPPGEHPTAWLSLDERDNNPASFWSYVIAALQTVAPAVGQTALSLLQSSQPPIDVFLSTLINDLNALPNDIVLVLDDYHVVDNRQVHDGLAFLLDHLPQQLHLVIATRVDPALPLPRLRARGDLVEIRAADLRFEPDEAKEYLNEAALKRWRCWKRAPKAGSQRYS